MVLTSCAVIFIVKYCAQAGESPGAQPAKSAGCISFINGTVIAPKEGTNNRGVIVQQTVPGITHIECYLKWPGLEPKKDAWNFDEFDEILRLCEERKLKVLVLPWIVTAPEWFRNTPGYAPLMDMQTGTEADFLSPWAPATLEAYEHFFRALSCRYRDRIGIIKLGCAGSTFGEVGLQIPNHFYSCGDRYARMDFRKRMLEKYKTVDGLNAVWGTSFSGESEISFPDPERRAAQRRRWVDFIAWIEQSQVRNMTGFLQIIRKYFPSTMLDIPLGFGSDLPCNGCDRTAICRAAADFKPVTVRSTHGSFNRGPTPLAYWFYKRMAPVCHRLGIGFGTEPPGGDLTHDELSRQYFEDAAAGVDYVFHYFQNYHQSSDVIGDYKRMLRFPEVPLVDIGVLYPSTQQILDLTHFPKGQPQFCAAGREFFDYDLVDENMIEWGMLNSYKVLVHTGGSVFRESTLPTVDRWLRAGGVLVAKGLPSWESLDGRRGVAASWLLNEDKAAQKLNARVFRIGRGRMFVIATDEIPDYVKRVNTVLGAVATSQPGTAPLYGFDGVDDHRYVTDFPSGRLVFDTTTLATTFFPKKQL